MVYTPDPSIIVDEELVLLKMTKMYQLKRRIRRKRILKGQDADQKATSIVRLDCIGACHKFGSQRPFFFRFDTLTQFVAILHAQ